MGREARNKEDLDLAPEVREKFEELVTLLSAHGFGSDGPPIDTTFSQIEAFGHQAGQMVARAVDEQLSDQHSEHFHNSKQCPACQADAKSPMQRKERPLQTVDGDVALDEPAFHCPDCNRDFFPSAVSIAN
jgi:hypothetical protein